MLGHDQPGIGGPGQCRRHEDHGRVEHLYRATSSSLATVNGQTIATQNFHLTVGTATVIVNETTTNASGELVRNAVHVTALGEDVIVAQARCRAPQAIVSESHLALLLPLSAAALLGGAILFVRRRGATPPGS